MDRISASGLILGTHMIITSRWNISEKQARAVVCTSPDEKKKRVRGLLRILNDKGEEKALWYIRHVYLKGKG